MTPITRDDFMQLPASGNDSPFMKFWGALNEHLAERGLPELTYGPARSLWLETLERARHAVYRAAA